MRGAIFFCNRETRHLCFKHKVFGLPASKENFVREVKGGTVLFLFDTDGRKMYGIFEAVCNGGMNFERNVYVTTGASYPAQVRFRIIWKCKFLNEAEFKLAIIANYYCKNKFNSGLDFEQVRNLLLFNENRKKSTIGSPRASCSASSNSPRTSSRLSSSNPQPDSDLLSKDFENRRISPKTNSNPGMLVPQQNYLTCADPYQFNYPDNGTGTDTRTISELKCEEGLNPSLGPILSNTDSERPSAFARFTCKVKTQSEVERSQTNDEEPTLDQLLHSLTEMSESNRRAGRNKSNRWYGRNKSESNLSVKNKARESIKEPVQKRVSTYIEVGQPSLDNSEWNESDVPFFNFKRRRSGEKMPKIESEEKEKEEEQSKKSTTNPENYDNVLRGLGASNQSEGSKILCIRNQTPEKVMTHQNPTLSPGLDSDSQRPSVFSRLAYKSKTHKETEPSQTKDYGTILDHLLHSLTEKSESSKLVALSKPKSNQQASSEKSNSNQHVNDETIKHVNESVQEHLSTDIEEDQICSDNSESKKSEVLILNLKRSGERKKDIEPQEKEEKDEEIRSENRKEICWALFGIRYSEIWDIKAGSGVRYSKFDQKS